MKPHTHRSFGVGSGSGTVFVSSASCRRLDLQNNLIRKPFFAGKHHVFLRISTRKRGGGVGVAVRCCRSPVEEREDSCSDRDGRFEVGTRREVLVTPVLAIGACFLRSVVARAEEGTEAVMPAAELGTVPAASKEMEEAIVSRIYDATVIGEPMALGKDKRKVWEALMNSRIVYLGEAEQVPIRDDRELELEIVRQLRKRCAENERPLSLALEAFPRNLQEQLNQYMDNRLVLVLLI